MVLMLCGWRVGFNTVLAYFSIARASVLKPRNLRHDIVSIK